MNDNDFSMIRRLVDNGYLEVVKEDPLYVRIKTLFIVDEYDEELGNFFRIDLTGKNEDYFHEGWSSFVFLYDPKRWAVRRIDEGRKKENVIITMKKKECFFMNEFEKLIRDGWVEIKTSRMASFGLSIERSHLRLDKMSVLEDNRFILIGTEDERDQVEMCKGMTYFYNPAMWKVKSLEDDINDINKGWHDEIELDERSKEILDSIWPVIHGRVMKMIDCGQ